MKKTKKLKRFQKLDFDDVPHPEIKQKSKRFQNIDFEDEPQTTSSALNEYTKQFDDEGMRTFSTRLLTSQDVGSLARAIEDINEEADVQVERPTITYPSLRSQTSNQSIRRGGFTRVYHENEQRRGNSNLVSSSYSSSPANREPSWLSGSYEAFRDIVQNLDGVTAQEEDKYFLATEKFDRWQMEQFSLLDRNFLNFMDLCGDKLSTCPVVYDPYNDTYQKSLIYEGVLHDDSDPYICTNCCYVYNRFTSSVEGCPNCAST